MRLLLAAGADANTNDGGQARYRSALKGSVEVNNPSVSEVLLDAGAQPDPGQPIAEAAAHRDLRCLRLLLSRGARVTSTWALGSAVFNDNPGAAALLLDALATAGGRVADAANDELPNAVASASFATIKALLNAGADPQATDSDGMSALRLAVRAGRQEIAARLRALGAVEDGTEVDRFLGACLNGDRSAVEQLLADHPDLPDRLADEDRAVIYRAAESRPAEILALMLEVGFSRNTRSFGELPLHAAAYHGNAAGVRVLLGAGAEVDARDERFESTALTFATVGSGEQAGKPGDWTGTVRLLIEAGASRDGAWITGKPPSEEVADLLMRYGITAGEPAGRNPSLNIRTTTTATLPGRSAPGSWPRSPGTWKPPRETLTWTCSARCCTQRSAGRACAATAPRYSTGIAPCWPREWKPACAAWRSTATPWCSASPWAAARRAPDPHRRNRSTRSLPCATPRSSRSTATPTVPARWPAAAIRPPSSPASFTQPKVAFLTATG